MLTDKMIVWRLKRGSREAMRDIYQGHKDYLLTLANALLNDVPEAQDVVHDVFVSFAQSIEDFRLKGSLKGYLATCVGNLARDRIRSRKRRPSRLDDTEPADSVSNSPADGLIHAEQLQRLRYALSCLPYEQREVIVLHLRGEMTFKTIAALQDVSINTAQGRYRYGLEKLRLLLDSEVKK